MVFYLLMFVVITVVEVLEIYLMKCAYSETKFNIFHNTFFTLPLFDIMHRTLYFWYTQENYRFKLSISMKYEGD